jgi:hypothetical protein
MDAAWPIGDQRALIITSALLCFGYQALKHWFLRIEICRDGRNDLRKTDEDPLPACGLKARFEIKKSLGRKICPPLRQFMPSAG